MRETPLHPIWILLLGVHCLGMLNFLILAIYYTPTPVYRHVDPMAPSSTLPHSVPPSLYNTWNKLARYQHHHQFFNLCISKHRVPKGMLRQLKIQLLQDNFALHDTCNNYLLEASINILQSLSEATSIKIKDLQRNLTLERAKLFSELDIMDAHNIWNATKCKLRHLNQHLAFTERRKYRKTIELKPNFTNIDPLPIRKNRTRRFRRNRSTKSRVTSIDNVADVNLTSQTTCPSIPDYSPINL